MTPQNNNNTIEVESKGFDLESKDYVLIRKTGESVPVTSIEEGVAVLQNDAKVILEVFNEGLKEHRRRMLASDNNIQWQLVEEDDEGVETLTPFTGNLISENKGKQLKQTVIHLAKTIFGYAKKMIPDDAKANKAAKEKAKADALAMILENPAAIERLRGQ